MIDKILLIDDSEPDNFLHEYFLKKSGILAEIVAVLNVEKAVLYLDELIEKSEAFPKIIFLDINMPRLNGWEFLDIVFMDSKYDFSRTKIFMLTTSLNPDDKHMALEKYQLAGFYNKPLNIEHISEIAENLEK